MKNQLRLNGKASIHMVESIYRFMLIWGSLMDIKRYVRKFFRLMPLFIVAEIAIMVFLWI